MTRSIHAITSDEAKEHDYQVEVYQAYRNESLPGHDSDFSMSCTMENPTDTTPQEAQMVMDGVNHLASPFNATSSARHPHNQQILHSTRKILVRTRTVESRILVNC